MMAVTAKLQHWVNPINGKENPTVKIKDSLVIRPVVSQKRKHIKELFAGYNGIYKPQEMDWGNPVGNEGW